MAATSCYGVASVERGFLASLGSIVLVDLLLAGDNAVVIAMAVRALPPRRRRAGILLGAAVAVALRTALTFFVAQLLAARFVKLAGGVLILWVAAKLFREEEPAVGPEREARGTLEAVKLIAIADVMRSSGSRSPPRRERGVRRRSRQASRASSAAPARA